MPETETAVPPSSPFGTGTEESTGSAIEPKVSPNGESDPKMFTQEDIQKARQQEKDKMYKRLESLNETVEALKKEAKERAESEEAAAMERQRQVEAAEAEEKNRRESEMSAKELLATKEIEWQKQMSAIQQQMEQERALRERESQYAELMEARQAVMQQYSDRIAPELIDMVMGETQEELVQSAEDLAARTERILSQTQEAMQYARQQTPTTRVTAPLSGENSESQRVPRPEDIRGMSMQEYAKHRRTLLGGGADGPRNRGLFG